MRRFCSLFLLILLLLPQGVAWSRPADQQTITDAQIEALLAKMGPEERVGQLCLVTFYGSDVSETSDIAELISRYHVGGVVLLAENDNFIDAENIPSQVYQLTTDLQRLAANPVQSDSGVTPDPRGAPDPYIPLFVGLEHDGSGWPHMQLFSGVTPLPSAMAIGATWDPSLAQATGQVAGQELSALGINLLLGPSVDVVETPPQPGTSGDLGTWVFGGETFWVSKMAVAYIRGVHEGSSGRLAVVPRHLAGQGAADRLASVEVPMVRKTLEELRLFDLVPFFAVTNTSKDSLDVADALMTGHISYVGFQGDSPRAATRPISLDSRALQDLMKLEPLATWRDQGGLIISDALGLRGVRRLYDRQGETFRGRLIAQDALMAGNDVLYMSQFGLEPLTVNQKKTIVDTIDYFVQAYQTDSAFQTRVDDAVRRILRKKLDLYGGRFDLGGTVLPASSGLSALGHRTDVTFSVAQSALTLLSPARTDLLTSPQSGERIVVFTDTREARKQCANCAARSMIPVDAFRGAVLGLYGPEASKLVAPADIQSYTFDQLVNHLKVGTQYVPAEGEDATAVPDNLSLALESADWVVFLMLDVDPSVPSSNAVKQFLAVSPIASDTRVVVMAMAAPYYLDSTEVGKLTAYYGLYGHTNKFLDVAARALFLNTPVDEGAPPVSVPSINYSIVQMTSPDPNQVIKLIYSRAGVATSETPTPSTVWRKGDVVQVNTGIIVDRNGHAVPDETPVKFDMSYTSEGSTSTNSISAPTLGGVAQTPPQPLDKVGTLSIQASSDPAVQSDTIAFTVLETGEVSVEVSSPDIPPTKTPVPTVTPTAVPVVTATPVPTPQTPIVNVGDLLMSLFGLAAISITVFVLGISRRDLNYGLLLSLPTVVLGLTSYNYYALYLPGSDSWRGWVGDFWGAGVFTWIGSLVGLTLTMVALYTVKHLPRASSGKRGRR